MRVRVLVVAGVLIAAAIVAVTPLVRPVRQLAAPRAIVLIVSGDTAGWIVPCGCTTNQSGGMPRRGQYVGLRNGSEQRVLLLDAGGAPGGTSPYHAVKFSAILAGEAKLGVAAHNIGAPEAALGAETLTKLARERGVPLLSANLSAPPGVPIADAIRLIERGGQRFAVTGVLSPKLAPKDWTAADPRDAILKAADSVRGKYDHLVVLAYLPEAELVQLAKSLPEADVVAGGPTGQSLTPRTVGPTWVASATNKGKFLVDLSIYPGAKAAGWAGRSIELTSEFPDNPEQLAVVKDYLATLAARDFAATETGLAPTLPANLPAGYRVAGSESCRSCHSAEHESLLKSSHSHAWETLSAKGFEVDAACQQCHTTGFGVPGGFESAKRSSLMRGVGCESCHGPSKEHADQPSRKTPYAAADQCVRCHDRENSPSFQFAAYWSKIVHGNPAKGGPP